MKVGVAVHDSIIAVALDFAPQVNLYEFVDGQAVLLKKMELESEILPVRAAQLADAGIGTLICGAISGPLATMLSYSGIEVISGVTGELERVLDAFVGGRLSARGFAMPGCGLRRRRRQCGRGCGRGRER